MLPVGSHSLRSRPAPRVRSSREPCALPGLEVDAGQERAGYRRFEMPQLRQFRDHRRDRGGFDAVDRHLDLEHAAIGEIAVVGVQLRHAGAERHRQRQIAPDSLAAAFDRDIDPVGPPGAAAALVVKDNRRAADADPPQQGQAARCGPAAPPIAQAVAVRDRPPPVRRIRSGR